MMSPGRKFSALAKVIKISPVDPPAATAVTGENTERLPSALISTFGWLVEIEGPSLEVN